MTAVPMAAPVCWVMSDGKAGMENQCLGLAEAVGAHPIIKRIALKTPWRQTTPYLPISLRLALAPESDPLTPPWPDLLITSGRQAVGLSLLIRRLNGGRTFCVHIQNPGVPFSRFDAVILPKHDEKCGPTLITTRGALHRVTPERLADAAARFAPAVAHLPRPRVAVLIGGSNGVYHLTPTVMGDVAEKLSDLARHEGVGLMVTPSRRTGADNEAILRARLAGLPATVWDGTGENPYFGFLGLADAVVVTCDSVSMVSEAASTGKPVYIIELEGGSPKFRRFHEMMYADGIARPFTGVLESWSYTPLDDTARVAAEVLRRMAVWRHRHGIPG
ncbi:mitochondrial fission ELM1 family protein [Rhodospirillum centenum]|uniref:Nucleoside-diphosphate sugar epimerase n=1 Tax=Rhodospirillum centenum (strain ATCC 51521 / SW) TaxID=414684 RepID=B6INZ1_RHOCS|nr:mitochondrial fission ELM1 family protein [Rhodospirillum centenum]ACI99411.1 conserved hypothetical protein [Rhodospirillum centenum SW]